MLQKKNSFLSKLYNPLKAHIVYVKDRGYALRRWSFIDLSFNYYDKRVCVWWTESSRYFKDCIYSKEEIVQTWPAYFNKITRISFEELNDN